MISLKINSINNSVAFRSAKNTGRVARRSRALLPSAAAGSLAGMGIAFQPNFNPIKLRKQSNRYNEKEPQYADLVNRIMELNKKLEDAEKNGEEVNIQRILGLDEGRLPDFSDREFDDEFFQELNDIDHTPIEIADFKREASIIKNKQLKRIAETICRKEQLNKPMLCYIRDIEAGLVNITDTKISKHLKAEIKRLSGIDYDTERYDNPEIGESNYFHSINRIGGIVDAYNAVTGKYSRYKTADLFGEDVLIDMSKPAEYMKNFRLYNPKNRENFIKALNAESDRKHPVVVDFESSEKTEALELLSNEKEMLDYMYDKYYVSKITDAPAKKLCREINRTYGVRVLLSDNTRDIRRALRVIKKELENWKKVSGGKAKLPGILDLNYCKPSYRDSSAYTDIRGNIHHKGAKIYSPRIIRHEIMHLNEPTLFAKYSADTELVKFIRSIIPSKKIKVDGREKEILDWENCKYREEFLKAGINPEHVEYAYTNRNEFLAVAAEGDFEQYSSEFKEVLIKIGMPEYVFNLPVDDFGTETNVERVQRILKKHPNANYDELVKFIEKEKAQELSPKEKLLRAIFGEKYK